MLRNSSARDGGRLVPLWSRQAGRLRPARIGLGAPVPIRTTKLPGSHLRIVSRCVNVSSPIDARLPGAALQSKEHVVPVQKYQVKGNLTYRHLGAIDASEWARDGGRRVLAQKSPASAGTGPPSVNAWAQPTDEPGTCCAGSPGSAPRVGDLATVSRRIRRDPTRYGSLPW